MKTNQQRFSGFQRCLGASLFLSLGAASLSAQTFTGFDQTGPIMSVADNSLTITATPDAALIALGYTYRWESSPRDGSGVWTEIPGGANQFGTTDATGLATLTLSLAELDAANANLDFRIAADDDFLDPANRINSAPISLYVLTAPTFAFTPASPVQGFINSVNTFCQLSHFFDPLLPIIF